MATPPHAADPVLLFVVGVLHAFCTSGPRRRKLCCLTTSRTACAKDSRNSLTVAAKDGRHSLTGRRQGWPPQPDQSPPRMAATAWPVAAKDGRH
eukprot:CAMPEP_0204312880 /NCGR_PEP_ID=MMETSP0469-20131031/3249_1 /ASSEMBLY_ACC=CAM_ASM_000384 /TAXON_ID=2969 /ORGANISM="Oxyrrhis marina" /LENGTH=93 /DNA_ID=CAMNT_0051293077 /DNA_START=34 /DNA_END=313 /DNA_ORIENTATION=+